MAFQPRTKQILSEALADQAAANDIIANLSAEVPTITPQAGIPGITVSATTGSLPAAATTQVIANAATPTVAELLAFTVSLLAQLESLDSKLHTAGVLTS